MKIAITDIDSNSPDDLQAAQSLLSHLMQRAGVAGAAPMPPAAIGLDAPDVGVDVQTPNEAFGAPATPEAAFGLVQTPEQAFAPGAAVGNVPAAGNVDTSIPLTASSAPAAPSAPPVAGAAAPAPAVDSRGLPHDPRIHAGTKSVKANGEWTAKRGVDPALVAQVEAELRQFMGQPAAAGAAPAPLVAAPPAPPAAAPLAPVAPPAPPAPAAAPATTGNPAVDAQAAGEYPAAVQKVAAYLQSGKLTQAELTSACMQYGAAQLPLFANRPDLLRQLIGHIDNLVLLKG